VFTGVTAVILSVYARQRHLAYRHNFPWYPPYRKALIPYIF
jgi:3-oxo-5-alpha-steroid 4-dehydrogenase